MWHNPRFLCRPTAFFSTCGSRGTSESSTYEKQWICRCNSASTHFHVSWLSDFISYLKPLYKSLHQSFFYSFITILPSESGVALDYSTILPYHCQLVPMQVGERPITSDRIKPRKCNTVVAFFII